MAFGSPPFPRRLSAWASPRAVATVNQRYAHLSPDQTQAAVERLAQGAPQGGPARKPALRARGPRRAGRHKSAEHRGAPGRNRTCDPRLRRPMLYPTELQARQVVTIQAGVVVVELKFSGARSIPAHGRGSTPWTGGAGPRSGLLPEAAEPLFVSSKPCTTVMRRWRASRGRRPTPRPSHCTCPALRRAAPTSDGEG